jgi:hypothetical protein
MTPRQVFRVGVLAVLFGSAGAQAAEPPLFLPGDRTTSKVAGEVEPSSEQHSDGVYGRFDGLFDLGLEGGAELRDRGTAGAALVSLHYLFMAGVYAEYTDALGGATLESTRTASFGVDVRPAFIPRWSNGLQEGPSVVDLTLDSISLALGAYFREPRDQSFGDRRGLELSLGFGVPLTGWAEGPWLAARGILRWDDPGDKSREAARPAALLMVGWHFTLGR